jgi:hypothetical protein
MKRHSRFFAVLVWVFFLLYPLFGQTTTQPALAGHWEGSIDIPGTRLEVDLDFVLQADGSWKGDISIPLQKATDLPLTGIVVNGADVSFAISGVPGEPTFKGTLAGDGGPGFKSQTAPGGIRRGGR